MRWRSYFRLVVVRMLMEGSCSEWFDFHFVTFLARHHWLCCFRLNSLLCLTAVCFPLLTCRSSWRYCHRGHNLNSYLLAQNFSSIRFFILSFPRKLYPRKVFEFLLRVTDTEWRLEIVAGQGMKCFLEVSKNLMGISQAGLARVENCKYFVIIYHFSVSKSPISSLEHTNQSSH